MDKSALLSLVRKIENSPLIFFVRNGHMAIVVLLGCVLGGIYALNQMPVESEPEVKIPIGIVSTPYPGASPSDTETLVTDELESRLKNIDELKVLTSNSVEGMSTITVEFNADADIQESIRELRDEVETVRSQLPEEAEDPIVTEVRAGDRPILTFAIVGNMPPEEFKEYGEELEDILESIRGVNRVDINGLPAKQMQVWLDEKKMEGFGLSPSTVSQAIAQNHIDVPVGRLKTNDLYYQVSLKAQFETPEELESLAIASIDGRTIELRDVATIRHSFAETVTETSLYTADSGISRAAVTLDIYKKTGEDLVRMADEAKQMVEEYSSGLPEGVEVLVTDDESERIFEDIERLLRSAWQTIVIIAIVLLLALGVREAIAAALSIPILYLISMVGLYLAGETFNFLTFFALILSLGVVIDTSIVIIEGVYEGMRKYGLTPREAALSSVATFRAPLIAGTLTTLAAFLPLGLMTGIMGEYVKHIPITVNITLFSSLLTALMILPAVSIWLLTRSGDKEPAKPLLYNQFQRLGQWYSKTITTILHSKRLRRRWLSYTALAFVLSGVLFMTGIVKFNLFSSVDSPIFFVTVNAPEGTALDVTKGITKRAEAIVQKEEGIERITTIYGLGSFNAGFGAGGGAATHKSRITINLVDAGERSRKSYDIAEHLRDELAVITDAEVLVEELSAGPPSGADIEVRILGDDIKSAQLFAHELEQELKKIEGTADVTNDLELSPGEYHIRTKRDRLEFFGVSAQQIGFTMRTAVFGDDSTEIKRGGEEEDIVVRVDYRTPRCTQDPINSLLETRDAITLCRSNPEDISELLSLQIPTSAGQVPLSELVDVSLQSAATTIRHYDTLRSVSVKGNVREGYVLGDIMKVFQARIDKMQIPAGITIRFGGENEDTLESMASLGNASILAILVIFVILVYQFKSFRQVFIVLSTMPLAVMGVLYGLAIIRVPLSFPGMIGMVALLGIVVNDAIVLIDKINTNRKFTDSIPDAVEAGCVQRLEPVIMTTLTTALGVIPLIFSGETFRDLAIVMAIGITIATIFTLVIIPILYVQLEGRTLTPRSIFWGMVRLAAYIYGYLNMKLKKYNKNRSTDHQNPDGAKRASMINNLQEGLSSKD